MSKLFLTFLLISVVLISGCIIEEKPEEKPNTCSISEDCYAYKTKIAKLEPYQNIIQNCYKNNQIIDRYTSSINNGEQNISILGISDWETDIYNSRAVKISLSSNGGLFGGYEPYLYRKTVTDSGSMLPTFGKGDNIIIEENNQNLKVGQIIIYKHNFGEVVHRIVSIEKDEQGIFYKTKGDNNCINDTYKVRPFDIKGRIIGVIW